MKCLKISMCILFLQLFLQLSAVYVISSKQLCQKQREKQSVCIQVKNYKREQSVCIQVKNYKRENIIAVVFHFHPKCQHFHEHDYQLLFMSCVSISHSSHTVCFSPCCSLAPVHHQLSLEHGQHHKQGFPPHHTSSPADFG